MSWEPLVKPYFATSEEDGVHFAHTYDATDDKTAEKVATDRGWTFCGEVPTEDWEIEDALYEREFSTLN